MSLRLAVSIREKITAMGSLPVPEATKGQFRRPVAIPCSARLAAFLLRHSLASSGKQAIAALPTECASP